ncbi:MAG: beta-ketoacyl synthase chain length factor [Chryseolinea sp.]
MEGKHYINGIGIITPQKTFANEESLDDVTSYHGNVLRCITPDFKSFINPTQLRRLSRMLRIGLTSSILCLKDAGAKMPDSIITATGYGFLEETEKFLREILDRGEKQLTPTFFMQGTYNALAGLVALSLKCTGYNSTYVSRGFAFENALNDGLMQITENPSSTVLIGAYDEAAGVQYKTGLRHGHYKSEAIDSLQLFETGTSGTIQGEGAAFFFMTGTRVANTWCEVMDLRTEFKPTYEELSDALHSFLSKNQMRLSEIDLLVSGVSGDVERDQMLLKLRKTSLRNIAEIRFKHLCGEYCTAISFAMWLGSTIFKKQVIADAIKVAGEKYPSKIETILILNHYLGRNWSFVLLRR